jgi:hypothetical protein
VEIPPLSHGIAQVLVSPITSQNLVLMLVTETRFRAGHLYPCQALTQ